jgi:hypothetical protein
MTVLSRYPFLSCSASACLRAYSKATVSFVQETKQVALFHYL